MSLFNQILSALDNPEQEANSNQIANIVNTVDELSDNYHTNPSALQSALSVVGNYVRGSLQEKRNSEGEEGVQNLVNQFAGNQGNSELVQKLFTTPQVQKMIEEIATKTGLPSDTIQSMLPRLVSVVMNLLKTGTFSQNPLVNSVLSNFLDSDRDGDVDVADALALASRYLRT